jgi:uncharacterized protein (DUF1684 family)
MRILIILFVVLFVVACDTTSKWKPNQEVISKADSYSELSPYAKGVMRHRDSTSAMFLSGANGILPKEDLSPTGKLKYFAPDEAFRIKATFTPIENGEVIEMQTSTDRLPEYKRYGTLAFKLGDSDLVLTLYQNVEQPDYFFCPYKDSTNGKESYGAGRYLDFTLGDLTDPIVDFNYAYNPYCAYNKEYSCPIPPRENHLQVAIPAGEKRWH